MSPAHHGHKVFLGGDVQLIVLRPERPAEQRAMHTFDDSSPQLARMMAGALKLCRTGRPVPVRQRPALHRLLPGPAGRAACRAARAAPSTTAAASWPARRCRWPVTLRSGSTQPPNGSSPGSEPLGPNNLVAPAASASRMTSLAPLAPSCRRAAESLARH